MPRIESTARSRPGKSLLFVFVAAQAFSVPIFPASAQTPASQLSVREPIVVRFAPPVPSRDTREESCWTE